MSSTSPKKSSLLSYGSPRASPFKRPESPLSLSPSNNAARSATSTPSSSPLKAPRVANALQFPEQHPSPTSSTKSTIFTPQQSTPIHHDRLSSSSNVATPRASVGDPFSRLNQVQIREMRESFQVLDRDNDGQITRDDVTDMLGQLGLDASASSVNPYFPSSHSQTLNLNTYLSTLSNLVSDMSRPDELMAAFSAFDVDDSGQIDTAQLREALLTTTPEKGGVSNVMTEREIDRVMEGFTSRRTFGKNTGALGRGDVFRYGEFVAEIQGGSKGKEGGVVVS